MYSRLSPFKSVNADLSPYYLAKAKDIILSLGTDTLPNEYLTHTLRELILKYTPEGSFNVWPKVLNYIRLSLHQNKKIDLANITSFFAMYQQRKDMTVINLPEALKIYEDGFITIEKALDIIVFTQSMSEKRNKAICFVNNLITYYQPPNVINYLVISKLT